MMELLDSVLAFSAVMLGVSLIITVLVQALSRVMNLRGQTLAEGIAVLFEQAKMKPEQAAKLADAILRHPLISDAKSTFGRSGPYLQASAIRKEELLRFLTRTNELGLELPAEVTERLERAAKVVEDWFDGQMDRISQKFSNATRVVTVAVSFIVAFGLHLDASVLLTRMVSDTETRAKLVANVESLEAHAERLGAVPAEAAPGTAPAPSAKEFSEAAGDIASIRALLTTSAFDIMPKFEAKPDLALGVHTLDDYLPWQSREAFYHLLGVLAAGALLSLGAPFWYRMLRQVASLKTVLATKEEEERAPARKPARKGAPKPTDSEGGSSPD
jgi:hypothetical protein